MQPSITDREYEIDVGDAVLPGVLSCPAGATGIVVFAHGSGSSRFSARNRHVAQTFNRAGLATLLFDLLTAEEHWRDERTREYRFDIPRLGLRLVRTVDWVSMHNDTCTLRIGLFGASTGAAATLIAAAERPEAVSALVARGGRPDLAAPVLDRVLAPTLLIVGGNDSPVIEMNREAARELRCENRLEIVPGASHLFEEPGKLEVVAQLARDWFTRFL
ncbi:dienelactone hydrolase family protein [Aquisalimonas sp.]|uniref:dienelactone hydrolase family protein n=1 Tax=unclassified Aquisalimonas TaxID=2644645 RepID=UPI0025B93F4C|nr:dienelactone hydrolase family protein [Aquisalimonas sp.]